ncbi:manganese efflux pump [candidate division KSB1 bacterium]|nr:manganese efflux pump [candidate division KSB1 bacterium]
MELLTIFLIAVGLSMDAFAVSISSGFIIPDANRSHGLRIGLFFGMFQAVMPVLGWFAGYRLQYFIDEVDHWIAFGLLAFVGCKMIYEAYFVKKEGKTIDPIHLKTLLLLSVATSIDALAVGLTFAVLGTPLFPAVLIIGFTTFIFSGAGVYMGRQWGGYAGKYVELIGGLILIGIGFKILLQHLGLV